MSVGHIARLLEAAGTPTVVVAVRSFRKRLEMMTVPRALLTPYLMGRPIGRPGDREEQKRVLQAALQLLETADQGGTIVDLET
jgi:hypothetical protein